MYPVLIHSQIIFNYARKAYLAIGDATPELEGNQMDTVPAIIFSVVAAEAFINEVGALAIQRSTLEYQEKEVALLASMWQDFGNKLSLKDKFNLAKTILTKEPYDKKENPLQDFSNLLTLRNAIVHMEPREGTVIRDGEIRVNSWPFLENNPTVRNLVAIDKSEKSSWIFRISTKAMARWACETTDSMIETLIEGVQAHHLRLALDDFFAGKFVLQLPSTE